MLGRDVKSAATTGLQHVLLPAAGVMLAGELSVPEDAEGVIVIIHDAGSDRNSPRVRRMAELLEESCFATLRFDLLTDEEDAVDAVSGAYRYDVDLLATRLASITDWVAGESDVAGLPIGYYAVGTGGAVALAASTVRRPAVRAVVARDAQIELAGWHLEHVVAPTLLILGDSDAPEMVNAANEALGRMRATERDMALVRRAGPLFSSPGALEQAAQLASSWFAQHLGVGSPWRHHVAEVC